ncbi:MAG: translation initiation factor IF-3 [Planctomycetota bacterium]|jgi:translation initiation factor IF-3
MAIEKNLRCNEQIRTSPIRLIDQNDQQVGIVELKEALAMAREARLDLVEVAPRSSPPVCRIFDYGKWKYARQKREQKAKAKRHESELKQIRIRTPKIGEHDLQIKIDHAREFLERGDRVQFTLRFRGRELAHVDEGKKVFERIRERLADVGKIERDYRMEGRQITMVLASVGKKSSKGSAAKNADA